MLKFEKIGTEGSSVVTRGNYKLVKIASEVEDYFLTFKSAEPFTLNVVDNTKYWDGTLEYSTDKTTWNEWNGVDVLNSGNTNELYLRGIGNTYITGTSAGSTIAAWVLTGNEIQAIGNIENLLDYQTVENGEHPTMAEDCYCYLFSDCSSLITAPELPATTLTYNCYGYMFSGCSSLITAPVLPAKFLIGNWSYKGKGCYQYMFERCSSLVSTPIIQATSVAGDCCYSMFYGCSSLTTLPKLYSLSLSASGGLGRRGCYQYMFRGCTNIKLSTTQDEEYKYEYRIPFEGDGTIDSARFALNNMFANTGGTFTETPEINTTYYTTNPPV